MEYYPAGYYPTDPWNQEESWEEATEEIQTQNEPGQNSEAQREGAGSVQGGGISPLSKQASKKSIPHCSKVKSYLQ